MLARMRKAREEGEGGFTLIELLVVIIIIGILAAIAIPVFLNQRKSGYDAGAKSDVKNTATALETYYTDNNAYTSATGSLPNWAKSAHTTSVTISLVGTTGYKFDGKSESNKHFCYDSGAAGSGVTTPGGTAVCP